MKKVIKLSESNLRHIIYESVLNVLLESTDTIDSATEKAKEKYEQYFKKYGENNPMTQHAYSQYIKFKNAWDGEYNKGNLARQARMLNNREKRQSGERNYVSGVGWRNNNGRTEPSQNNFFGNKKEDIFTLQPGQKHIDSSYDDGDFLYIDGKVFILKGYIGSARGEGDIDYHCMSDGTNFDLDGFMHLTEEELNKNLYYATNQQYQELKYIIQQNGFWWSKEDKLLYKL